MTIDLKLYKHNNNYRQPHHQRYRRCTGIGCIFSMDPLKERSQTSPLPRKIFRRCEFVNIEKLLGRSRVGKKRVKCIINELNLSFRVLHEDKTHEYRGFSRRKFC